MIPMIPMPPCPNPDVSERLDVIPAQLKVVVTRRFQICLPRLRRRSEPGPTRKP
jgi:hypothetical protein